MLRVGVLDWSAEQHEAAAAALGAHAAMLATLPSFGPDAVWRAMDAAQIQAARYAAIDAASHAHAAERERERQAEWLARNEFVKVCAWCAPDERPAVPEGVKVTHGICARCAARQLAEISDPRA